MRRRLSPLKRVLTVSTSSLAGESPMPRRGAGEGSAATKTVSFRVWLDFSRPGKPTDNVRLSDRV